MKFLNVLSDIKAILLAPLTNIICGGGILLVIASFAEYDKIQGLSLHRSIHWQMTGSGFLLTVVGAAIYLWTHENIGRRTKLDYEKGVEIKRGEVTILVKAGEIQAIQGLTTNSAVVLPANTTFIDDCAADKRSAMGAFFGEHFPGEIGNLPALFKQILGSSGKQPIERNQYAPGTTFILPDRFWKPAKIVVTASTIRSSESGMTSNPYIICNCVEGILRATADERVDTIYLPILGSGHGGVDRGLALLFLLLALLHFLKFHHHIRKVQIVVHPKDVDGLNQSKELRQIVAL
jgi:hypothetical protein